MSMSNFFIKSFQLTTLATALALAGCGGGGNDTLPSIPSNTNNTSSTGTSTTSTNTSTTTTDTASSILISAITLTDSDGKPTSSINNLGAKATVKVTSATGEAISGAIVTFSGNNVSFGTSNGAVLTNADGEASISVKPTNISDTGAYALSATADFNGNTVTSSTYPYTLQAVNVALVNMKASTTNLTSGGSANITLNTQNASTNSALNDIVVDFKATCGTFTSDAVTSVNGAVTTTYKAITTDNKLCEGTQTITATTASGSSVQQTQVTVANIEANSIIYTKNTPTIIPNTNSSMSISGEIEFTVFANGVAVSDKEVDISLIQAPSDLSLSSTSLVKTTKLKSDSSGKVTVRLYPGALSGPVEVRATLTSNRAISTISKNVSITTGRAPQEAFSLSVSKNSLQNDVDGDSATITARFADRLGNTVPDGTVVNFVTEGGKVDGYCATSDGVCTVNFTTQNPRPVDGRVTVLAYVEGNKQFTDLNGNNIWDNNEPFVSNIGDFFRDDNENGLYDAGEFLYKRGETGGTCAPSTFGQPNIPNTCSTGLDATLRGQMLLYFADETPTIVLPNPLTIRNPLDFSLFGNSAQTTPMPSGTTVKVEGIDNTKDNNLSCKIEMRSGPPTVPAIADIKNTPNYSARIQECGAGDEMKLTIKTPAGGEQNYFFTLQ